MKQILNRYQFDDMMVCYEINDEKQVGLFLYPADKPLEKCANPDTAIDSLVQLKIAGDMYNGAYAPGNTLRNGESTIRMKYVSQKLTEENNVQTVITVMEDDRGYQVTHKLSHVQGEKVLRAECEFLNKSAEAVKLEMFESSWFIVCRADGVRRDVFSPRVLKNFSWMYHGQKKRYAVKDSGRQALCL